MTTQIFCGSQKENWIKADSGPLVEDWLNKLPYVSTMNEILYNRQMKWIY
jgi:hypothetical protein